jgi:hypothetical protein
MKKKNYSVNVTYTIIVSGTVEVQAEDEEEAERLAEEKMPDVTWTTPDGWDCNEIIETEVDGDSP